MKILRTLLVVLFAIKSVAIASAQDETATLKIRFKYKGKAPVPRLIAPRGFPALRDESLIVNSKNNGIQNVVVFVKSGRGLPTLPPQKPLNRNLKLDLRNGRFEPHILLGCVGDTITATNRDPVAHSVSVGGFANELGFTVPANQLKRFKLAAVEPTLIPISCIFHPWMKAYMLVVDHPFAGVSDKDGLLEIKGLPTETKLVFQAWHETGTFKEDILVKGKQTKWRRNRLELELEAGIHDLGTVEIPGDQFDL